MQEYNGVERQIKFDLPITILYSMSLKMDLAEKDKKSLVATRRTFWLSYCPGRSRFDNARVLCL